jgi:hypothetical protein
MDMGMNITMKKLDKNSELFYKISITKSFGMAIEKIRKELSLPALGLKNDKDLSRWMMNDMEKAPSDESENYLSKNPWVSVFTKLEYFTQLIVNDFSFPQSLFNWVRYYILYNNIEKPFEKGDLPFGCMLLNEYNSDARLIGEKMIVHKWPVILIHPMTSQRDVIKFVKKYWKHFPNAKTPKAIKRTMYKERDSSIYNKSLEGKNEYRITKELKIEGYNVEPEHVRKIISKERKNRNK